MVCKARRSILSFGLVVVVSVAGVRAAPWVGSPARRGGSDNPLTDDPATVPTVPPVSSYKNGVPMINGSEGGFIGLIVGLGIFVALVALGGCYLLRWRRHRRGDSEKRRSDGPPGSSGLPPYETKTSFPKPGGNLFGQKKKKGWIKTNDGQEDDGGIELRGGKRNPQGPYLAGDAAGAFSSASTVRLPPQVEYTPSPSIENLDPFDTSGSPPAEERAAYDPVMRGSDAPESSPTSTFTRTTFEGGTKFRESF